MTKTDKKQTLVLFDAHAILHRAYHALPDFSSSKGEPTGGLYGLSSMLMKIMTDLEPDYMAACYDLPEKTYRHVAYEDYKAGRRKADDELVAQMERSKDVFEAFGVPIYAKAGFEADDILGTVVEQLGDQKNLQIIIASGDMDTLQLVKGKKVQVYTLRKGIKDTILYDEKAVKERFNFGPELVADYKGLRGDPSDNIPGIAGIGEKTATQLITQFGSIEDIYKKLGKDEEVFKKAGIKPRVINLLKEGAEEAEFSKMLATIRRDVPIEFSIPEKTWSESADPQKVLDLFAELEFRNMTNRVKDLFGISAQTEEKKEVKIDKKTAQELALGVWLLDSTNTNPELEDVWQVTKTRDPKKAKEIIEKKIKEYDLSFVYEKIEKPLIDITQKMHDVGVAIDSLYLEKLQEDFSGKLATLEQKIWKEAGIEFNINSPKQLGEVLFDNLGLKPKNAKKTSTGARSTRESELEKMKDDHAIIGLILEYREIQKLQSTYVEAILSMISNDGRLHAYFSQSGTTTGRMSSKNPNLQNIPIRSEMGRRIRNAFIAKKGCVLLDIDYSQIELRIAAMLSGDRNLIDVFKEGRDIHSAVASRVFGVDEDKVSKSMRSKAKVINFGILYGMGVNALKQNLDSTREEAGQYLRQYFEKYPTLAKYLEKIKSEARRQGYVATLFGRRRYFEGIDSRLPYVRSQAERMAINAPIQGTSADIIKKAMVDIDQWIKKEGKQDEVSMLMQVHDELVFEIDEKKVLDIAPHIIKMMESVVPAEQSNGVPIKVDAGTGETWGSIKPLKD